MEKQQRRAAICAEVVRLIGEKRKSRHVSKNALATMTGLNQSTVSRFENYPENPTLDSLLRIADALNISLGDVFNQAVRNVDAKPLAPKTDRKPRQNHR